MDILPENDKGIEKEFPEILEKGYKITSPKDVGYNCIGWAAEDKDNWWWPDTNYQYFWPSGVPREFTPNAFTEAYKTIGYELCDDHVYEDEYEKIAIYVVEEENRVTHASRQISKSKWTSKLGSYYDISHDLEGLNGKAYAQPKIFMKRKTNRK